VPVLFGPKNAGLVTRSRRCFGPAINLFAALQTVDTGPVTTGSMGSSDNSASQLVQAMAGFVGGSGAADTLNTAPLGADTSQQTLLTAPQH
jgi:hypothetical protein